ncbi:MAG TPA: Do family serine endopeptidase [Bacteroidia bacterium]|nr:Do family serine endopeptidase [Bacteroidia bacterium]
MKRYVFAFVIALAGGAGALGLERLFLSNGNSVSSIGGNVPAQYASLNGAPLPDFTPAAEQTVHAVVHVMTKFTTTQTYYDPFQGMFGGNGMQTVPQEQQASGSGVIVSKDGYIVTNYHVIEKAEEIQVTLNDKRAYEATLVGSDPNTDLAVLKIEEEGLPFITWGNSDNVKIGEWVLAVGNPFNLTSTVTAGIVSAKARNINIIAGNGSGPGAVESFIQTDAAVNPGNSGGALVNTAGHLVGINTAIASQNGTFTGYSFAIPVNLVKKIVSDLIEFGMVQRGYLGVNIQDVDANLAKDKNLDKVSGVYVMGVLKDGAAEDAELEAGDVITAIDNVSVHSVGELQEQINRHRPGDQVEVTYMRKGDEEKTSAVLKNKNNTTEIVEKEDVEEEGVNSLGATFELVPASELKRLGITAGVEISKLIDGKLRNSGIKEGFIITMVDKTQVGTPEQLKELLEKKKGGILLEGVYPNGKKAYYALAM